MFSFFKSALEKDLIKLGFGELVNGYKQKVKTNEWTKQQFNEAIKAFHAKHKSEINNLGNVNVSTRQSFDVDDQIVPLNLQNIQQEFIDVDFIYSSLLFEYTNHKRIHSKALQELTAILNRDFPDATIDTNLAEALKTVDLKSLIDQAIVDPTFTNKNSLKTIFQELNNRL